MSVLRFGAVPLRLAPFVGKKPLLSTAHPPAFRLHPQTRLKHNRTAKWPKKAPAPKAVSESERDLIEGSIKQADALEQAFSPDQFPKVRVRYVVPAVWALVVSGGIFAGLAFLQARQELKPKKSQGWLELPQWSMQERGPPTPTELAKETWEKLNPISKLSCGIVAANSAVHLSSFVASDAWRKLWHMPARNVNYTQFTSMFVHSGAMHFGVNMYAAYMFLQPVGYSRAFEGSPYHLLSFFLSTGVLSSFAQHWATLIPTKQKRVIPEIFIRSGGASGALLGVLGVFCVQYPTAGLGILFVPVHFDAQYVLPAVMLFDFVGMVRGYSFVNFGHAAHLSGAAIGAAYSYFDGKSKMWNPLVNFWKRQLRQKS